MPKPTKPPKVVPGPKPDRLKIEGDWEEAIKVTFDLKKPPPKGWKKPN